MLRKSHPVVPSVSLPSKVRTSGNPDEIVPLQVRLPLWMKRQVIECAQAKAQDLSEWMRAAIREAIDRQQPRSKKAK
jgi:hypothetical protein